jgi:hypothetical protein
VSDHVEDLFERVRREQDPVRQAKLAGELIAIYQQRGVELARLRKEAINRARDERGLNYATIAEQLGLTRGRITQIRQTAPTAERAIFGVGPVTVAIPERLLSERALPVISSEDARAGDMVTHLLTDLAFVVERFRIPPGGEWEPRGDVVAICGPKSSAVTAQAIESDPFLRFDPDDHGQWTIRERDGSRVYRSPLDERNEQTWSDVAYLGRLLLPTGRSLFVIAGVHALGSVGAVAYLRAHLPELYAQVGTHRFSMVVGSDHDGEVVTRSEVLCPPRVHD